LLDSRVATRTVPSRRLANSLRVSAGLPAVQSWQATDPGTPASYLVTVSDPAKAAPAVTRALVAAGADVLSIAESKHTLEDVYLELVEDSEGQTR